MKFASVAVRICLVVVAGIGAVTVSRVTSLFGAPGKPTGVKAGIRAMIKMEEEYIAQLSGDDAVLKPGTKINVFLQSGKKYEDVELTELQPGKEKNSFKVLGCTSGKGQKQKLQASTLTHIATENGGFDVVQDAATKAFYALDLSQRDKAAEARLGTQRQSLWPEISKDERDKAIEDAKSYFKKCSDLFPGRNFLFQETEFYLFYTDMPQNQVAPYVANLDAMYRQLCTIFGVPPGKNIWKGKCPVLAFVEKEMYYRFERDVMNNPNAEGSAGLHHGFGDGRVVVTCCRGNDPAFFAHVLVHETAHGFLHRFRSNVHIKSWINEGIADWVAEVVVQGSVFTSRRQSDAIANMRRTGTMGNDFFRDQGNIDGDQYGVASSLAEFMIETNPNLYRAFLLGIKEGYSIEESLKLTYGGTPADLVQSYGRSIGVPNLKP